jgi:putative hemolysin
MEPPLQTALIVGLLLILGNAFFVAAEYALVGTSRRRIEALAKKGSKSAKLVLAALDDMSTYVAGIQTLITLFGLGIGALTEPAITAMIKPGLSFLPEGAVSVISVILMSFPLVVLGELVPKYAALPVSDRFAMATIRVLRFSILILTPLVWAFKVSGRAVLKPFGVNIDQVEQAASREEIDQLLRDPTTENLDATHANLVSKALRLDQKTAEDLMNHRVDIQWLPLEITREELAQELKKIPHSRIPVARGDLDDIVGVVYLQDLVGRWDDPDFTLESILRPAEFVPESMGADRLVQRMREAKTQILIVSDEYGGTSGLLTLEDITEEVFGDLEDRLEADRPPIERVNDKRIVARADVRYDEVLEFLDYEDPSDTFTTETLSEIVMEELKRIPVVGDTVALPIGTLRVDHMTRRRVIRVSVEVTPRPVEAEEE